MEIRKRVVDFIEKLKNEEISDYSMNLFETGLLTSLDVLDLISYLEDNFDIQFSEDDISIESFGTIDNMVNLIENIKEG